MKKIEKSLNKGITLIALIITIIVLLILAGIVLAMVVGDNGIIAKAQTAKERTNESQAAEENRLKDYETYVDTLGRAGSGTNLKSDGTEVKTGDTLDGKPIYAKYIETTINNGGVNHNIDNVDKIWIDLGYTYTLYNSDEWKNTFFTLPEAGGTGSNWFVSKTKITIGSASTNNWNGQKVMVLVRYTKTTD